jgi:hypothetical protein
MLTTPFHIQLDNPQSAKFPISQHQIVLENLKHPVKRCFIKSARLEVSPRFNGEESKKIQGVNVVERPVCM